MTARTTATVDTELSRLTDVAHQIEQQISIVIEGKPEAVRMAVVVLLARGHLLVEDVPGVGKTTLAKALARSLDGEVRRIQFTPDLLPGDVTGVTIWNSQRSEFEFKPGAVFANVVIGDEINRASPKTQSALLECMEEGTVSVDGTTYVLQRPFIVVATQNPVEMEGTYPLPEAQRDRFMARLSMGYPDRGAELDMLDQHGSDDPLERVVPVADAATVAELSRAVGLVHVAAPVKDYVVDLVTASRRHPELRLGASPRASLHLLRAARAHAALLHRDYVLPDDIATLAESVLAHRLLLTSEARVARRSAADIVAELVERTPVDPARR